VIFLVRAGPAVGNIQNWLLGFIGGLLLVILGESLFLYHTIESKQQCKDAVVYVNKQANDTKTKIETNDKKAVQATQDSVSNRIDAAVSSLRKRQSGGANLPNNPSSSPSTPTESTAPVVPTGNDMSEQDREICVTNTILAEGWQEWYSTVKDNHDN